MAPWSQMRDVANKWGCATAEEHRLVAISESVMLGWGTWNVA